LWLGRKALKSDSHAVSRAAHARVLREPETVALSPLLHRLLGDCSLAGSEAAGTPRGSSHRDPSGRPCCPGPAPGVLAAWWGKAVSPAPSGLSRRCSGSRLPPVRVRSGLRHQAARWEVSARVAVLSPGCVQLGPGLSLEGGQRFRWLTFAVTRGRAGALTGRFVSAGRPRGRAVLPDPPLPLAQDGGLGVPQKKR